MSHCPSMDHEQVASYVAGRLSDDDTARLEAHLIECQACQDEVEMLSDMRTGLREARDAGVWPVTAVPAPAKRPWWILAPAWALAGIVIAAVPAFFLIRSANQRIAQLDTEKTLIASLNRIQHQAKPAMGVPVLSLSLTRGATAVVPRIHLPASQHSLILSLEYPLDPQVKTYRAKVEMPGKSIEVDLLPVPDGLVIELQSESFVPGGYTVILEGVTATGRSSVLGKFHFEIT